MMHMQPTIADLEYEREITRRRVSEHHTTEAELTAAISRTETILERLRADLNERRKKREQSRSRIETINRQLQQRHA